jgi:O-methyltransferase involved in polyketide biosynthesis
VPVDFERDDVREKLAAAGFQQNSPAFFTWLGVVPYLTQDAIGRTLDYMSSIQNSEVVFDYVEPPEAFSEELDDVIDSNMAFCTQEILNQFSFLLLSSTVASLLIGVLSGITFWFLAKPGLKDAPRSKEIFVED